MRIHIALADSHPAVLAGVELVLSKFEQFNITGMARNAAELETLLATTHCDVLVADVFPRVYPHRDGLSLLADIRRRYPALQIVLFTISDQPAMRRAALKIGIRTIVRKSDEAEALVEAVRAASHQIPPHVATAPAPARQPQPDARFAPPGGNGASLGALPLQNLTRRELEVLRLYASGLTVTQIARRLNRARQTVSTQKLSAMRKCGVARDVDLFRLVYENPRSLDNDETNAMPPALDDLAR
jgi:two-component system, NarL family, captular synthesis response regulator RcsB